MPDSFEKESKLSRRRAARRRQIRLMEEAASGLSLAGSDDDDDLLGVGGAASCDAVQDELVSEQVRAMLGTPPPCSDGADEGVAIYIIEDRTIPHPPSTSFCFRSPHRPPSGQSRPRSATFVLSMFSLGCLLIAALVAGLTFSFERTPLRGPRDIGLRAHLGRPPRNGGGGDGTEVGEAREGSPSSDPSQDEADSPTGRDEIDSPIGRDEVDSPTGEEEWYLYGLPAAVSQGEEADLSEFCGECQFGHMKFDCETMVEMEMHQYGITEEDAKRSVLGDCTLRTSSVLDPTGEGL